MQQHPIPQNVISFEDRLIGDFTIHQFVILAIGAVICFALYLAPLPIVLQYGLMISVGIFCAALALVKIQGMSLDEWIKNLVLAVYGPTQFIWRKGEFLPAVLTESVIPLTTQRHATGDENIVPDFSNLFPEEKIALDEEEKVFIDKLFFETPVEPSVITSVVKEAVMPETKSEEVSWEEFQAPQVLKTVPGKQVGIVRPTPSPTLVTTGTEKTQPEGPFPQPFPPQPSLPKKEKPKEEPADETYSLPSRTQVEVQPANVITPLASEINFGSKPFFTLSLSGKKPSYISSLTNLRINRALKNIYLAGGKPLPIRGERKIEPSPAIEKRFGEKAVTAEELVLPVATKAAKPVTQPPSSGKPQEPEGISLEQWIEPVSTPQPQVVVQKAVTSKPVPPPPGASQKTEAEQSKPKPKIVPPPFKPAEEIKKAKSKTFVPASLLMQAGGGPIKVTVPNLIYGNIKNQAGDLIEGAIIIVKDQKGLPVRALKSNHLGQFMAATPLPNGKYQIEFEKPDYNFDIIELELGGEVLNPIEVAAS